MPDFSSGISLSDARKKFIIDSYEQGFIHINELAGYAGVNPGIVERVLRDYYAGK